MATSILSIDFVGICLLCADCDIGKNLEEIVSTAERFQQETNRHFGILDSDFRGALTMLIFNDFNGSLGLADCSLKEVMLSMLRYHEVYFNDEGEHWLNHEQNAEDIDYLSARHWCNYSKEEYQQKILLRNELQMYLIVPGNLSSAKILAFLAMNGIDKNLFYHCSRPGVSS